KEGHPRHGAPYAHQQESLKPGQVLGPQSRRGHSRRKTSGSRGRAEGSSARADARRSEGHHSQECRLSQGRPSRPANQEACVTLCINEILTIAFQTARENLSRAPFLYPQADGFAPKYLLLFINLSGF